MTTSQSEQPELSRQEGSEQTERPLTPPEGSATKTTIFALIQSHQKLLLIAGVVFAATLYLASIPGSKLAFYVDESSIAYNAYTISRSGTDEYGARWPLYFQAFGEYKNPVYVYLLAALFRVFGPSVELARTLSAVAGCAAALLLGWLAWRVTSQRRVGIIVGVTALLTPWLFEVSRLVFEVALFPLALTLFLLAVYRAYQNKSWSVPDGVYIALTLGLITYTYSIGRLFGPLLAAGLFLFLRRADWREQWPGIIRAQVFYAVTLIPLALFIWRNPKALSSRFAALSYLDARRPITENLGEFVSHLKNNLDPVTLLVNGDQNILHHVPVMGSFLAGALVLAVIGLVLVIRHHWRDSWWRFVLYGLAVSVMPASLVRDDFHTLRLIPYPIFLLLLGAPAWAWLLDEARQKVVRQGALALLVLIGVQGLVFQWLFYDESPKRNLDMNYQKVLDAAVQMPNRPIYLAAGPGHFGYTHAYWYGLLRGLDATQFAKLSSGQSPPPGALVISEAYSMNCPQCRVVKRDMMYVAYLAAP
jgi:4-amino-4-deoxy-L-arabinose transferase-like glycosyltransferase